MGIHCELQRVGTHGAPQFLYVGTYTEGRGSGDGPHGRGSGIDVISCNPLDGVFGATCTVAELLNRSYFILHHDTDRLFSVEELGRSDATRQGAVAMFEFDRSSGSPHPLGSVKAGAAGPMRFTYTLTMVSIKSAFSQTGRASYQQRQVAGRGKSPFAQQADGRRFKRIGIIDRRLSQGARERQAHSQAKRLDAAHRIVCRQHRCGATDHLRWMVSVRIQSWTQQSGDLQAPSRYRPAQCARPCRDLG